ncbi:hypothetical protein C1703_03895 [Streptomyces sp. Go-475]|nr:hypothetical protein C1703_03895 [Streptomyces sp. Go-475]
MAMSSDNERRAASRPRYVCRSCEQPVDAVMERHKTMGVFVPVWVAGPCHNQRCEHYVPELVTVTSVRGATWQHLTGWKHD